MKRIIVLFTDFGVSGPYVGQMKSVLVQQAPEANIIDLFADVPAWNIKAAAYLLSAYVDEFPPDTIFLCVIDPGVGTASRLPAILNIDGRWYVGPDNGLFNVVAQRAGQRDDVKWWEITWQPDRLSSSFHGRDLFAPVAAMLARGDMPAVIQQELSQRIDLSWPEQLSEVIYLDHFGNLMTGIQAKDVSPKSVIVAGQHHLRYARTFADVLPGESFWYENANGLLELATNQGRACDVLSLDIGDSIAIE